jgi:thiol-disulfide isomerase/thioredoxin
MFLLALTLLHPALASDWMNRYGPGSSDDWHAKPSRCDMWGAPNEGFHVVTITTDKPWDQKIDGIYNQHIAADLPSDTAAILKDPANGITGYKKDGKTQNYKWENSFFNIAEGFEGVDATIKPESAGYPVKPLPESVTTLLKGNQQYCDIAGNKDYMLLFFGAGWCRNCQYFTPRLANYYVANKDTKDKTFEVVYFSDDNDAQEYDEFVKSWDFGGGPLRGLGYDMELMYKLKFLFKLHTVPTVVVIDKQGQTVTIEGEEAISGIKNKKPFSLDGFPLADGREFWMDQTPEEAAADDCSTDIAEQVKEIKDAVQANTDNLTSLGLHHFAEKIAGSDTLPTGDEELRKYLIQKYDAMIDFAADTTQVGGDAAARMAIQKLYEQELLEEDSTVNVKFQKDDKVEVKEDFMSDAHQDGRSSTPATLVTKTVPFTKGETNIGTITAVELLGGASYWKSGHIQSIQVHFKGEIYKYPWINADKFKFLKLVTK